MSARQSRRLLTVSPAVLAAGACSDDSRSPLDRGDAREAREQVLRAQETLDR